MTHRTTAQKRDRYRGDPVHAANVRRRSGEYGKRPEVRERRKKYLKAWNAKRSSDPEKAAADRVRRAELSAQRRLKNDQDPDMKEARLRKRRDAKLGVIREIKVENYLRDEVMALGGLCQKWVDPGRKGAPDRIVMVPGHPAYFVELKRPKLGHVEKHQHRYHEAIRDAGQQVFVLFSHAQVDEFISMLKVAN